MRLSKEAKIGLFITTALVVLYSGFTFLQGKTVFKRDPTYYTVFEDVRGLGTGGAVLLHGLQVGKVRSLDMLPGQKLIRVTFTTDRSKHIELTDATVAKLVNNSLLGGRAIELSIKEGKPLPNGGTIVGQVEQDLEKLLTEYSRPILQDVKDITVRIYQFMTKLVKNTDDVCTNLVMMAQELRQAIATNQTTLNAIGKNLADASGVLADKEIGWGPLLARLNQLADEVEDMKLKDMAVKLNTILNRLADGPLYKDLDQILIDLDQLLVDIKANPSKYIRLSFFGGNAGNKEPKDNQ